jgi:hypothetical protein
MYLWVDRASYSSSSLLEVQYMETFLRLSHVNVASVSTATVLFLVFAYLGAVTYNTRHYYKVMWMSLLVGSTTGYAGKLLNFW